MIKDEPLPVGTYPMINDQWWAPGDAALPSFPSIPIGRKTWVTKYRIDESVDESVHYLQTSSGTRVAMIGTRYFMEGFWERKHPQAVTTLLERLYHECGIYAFACYSMHHAIVLYADLSHGSEATRITPSHLAALLLRRDDRASTLVRVLADASLAKTQKDQHEAMQTWADNYVRRFELRKTTGPKGRRKTTGPKGRRKTTGPKRRAKDNGNQRAPTL